MSFDDTPLTADLVEGLWDALREVGAPVGTNARPGLGLDEMETLAAQAGIVLSDECRTWWRHYDGATQTEHPQSTSFGPGMAFASFREALRFGAEFQEIEDEESSGPGDPATNDGPFWARHYLALVQAQVTATADLSDADQRLTPVRMIDHGGVRFPFYPDLPSIGAFVQLCAAAIVAGEWFYDHGSQSWTRRGTTGPGVFGIW